jgi:predicted regulator of Ras-like GTPase activity (Roadblock/LC7/MglB family)
MLAEVAGNNSSAAFSEGDMLRERLAANIGTAGDTEIMSLNTNSRVVVSVPADTKIYIVFTKRDESNIGLRKVTSAAQ